ncbi:hypothetical protein PUR57_08455 [Streptomyces sp. JV176]|uniref:hypothetical protein n=1 Tax=Streptomyces sp. JV176 TaxID=858630 RepID=UPI002E7A3D91|nr:hypothetical protein [Streptomyces sp. JV176]MEE1798703.1 hypothetical protein [Streptomyces sp. JV176]
MGFDEEWGRLRSDATASQSAGMRLNSAGTGPLLPGTEDLAATPAQKASAANTIETELEPNTKKAGVWADETSGSAVTGLEGWETAAGLKKVQETWEKQVKALMGRLSAEKGALRATSGLFVKNDVEIDSGFAPLRSKLNNL